MQKNKLGRFCVMDKNEIKKALDKFEDSDYVSSRDLIAKELKKKLNSYLKDKTQVEKDPVEVPDEEPETDDNPEPDEEE